MTPALLERSWPFFVAVVVAGVSAAAAVLCDLGPFPIALPAGTMTFGIVVSGFVATQRNMLLTMSGAEVLDFAVRTGYHKDILVYLMDGIRAGLLVTAISLWGFFNGTNDLLWDIWLPCLVAGATLVVCLIIRNEILVNRLVEHYLRELGAPSRSRRKPPSS